MDEDGAVDSDAGGDLVVLQQSSDSVHFSDQAVYDDNTFQCVDLRLRLLLH